MRIAAIDQGTTSTRALVFDSDGPVEIAGSRRHETSYPDAGWVEQDANELIANIRNVLGKAGPVDAIGLANQGESCLAWDAVSKEPLSPVIVWQDSRTAPLLEAMAREGATEEVAARAALPLDPYFSAGKLGWIVENLPAARTALSAGRLRLGTTDAFFLDRLTGHFATDRATASRTSLMNIETGEWDPELCRLFKIPIDCLPDIRTNTAGFGAIDGIPVTAAIVDQQAALYGHGCRQRGDAKITFGTGAFALAVTGSTVPREALSAGLVPTVAWDFGEGPVYALDGGVQDAGSAIDWGLRAGLAEGLDDFNGLDRKNTAIDRGLVFVPAFSGLGCPFWDRSAGPLIIGLRPDMGRPDMCQALLEGVALMTATVLHVMRGHVPLAQALSIDGGLSKNAYFSGFLADCSGFEIIADDFSERTAYGVASLAARALGGDLALSSDAFQRYAPQHDKSEWRSRFDEAIHRCRGWHR
jgi:glycerol kinase